jgi:hypothetical protein
MNPFEAAAYCENLELGDRTDWYVPDQYQYSSIRNGDNENNRYQVEYFPNTAGTPYYFFLYGNWRYSFSSGSGIPGDAESTEYVRRVRDIEE